ncbi:ephrin-A4 isoform X1 [Pogoniulus pusillus]
MLMPACAEREGAWQLFWQRLGSARPQGSEVPLLGGGGRGAEALVVLALQFALPGRFLRDDYTVQVAINDYLDIYCPHYEGTVPASRVETFTLFMVDQEGYRGCYETPGAFKRWECNRPWAPFGPIRFSEKIQRFTPFPLGFEFQPGETYYYFSVPSPESAGRCLKLRVSVCCRDATPEPLTEVPNSQPHGHGRPEDAVSARGVVAPLQPHTPCLALMLLALLWM